MPKISFLIEKRTEKQAKETIKNLKLSKSFINKKTKKNISVSRIIMINLLNIFVYYSF